MTEEKIVITKRIGPRGGGIILLICGVMAVLHCLTGEVGDLYWDACKI